MKRTLGIAAAAACLLVLGCGTDQDQDTTDTAAADTSVSVQLTEVWSLTEGLDRPESAVYDADRDLVYVSSIGGNPTDQDGDGYISTVSADGAMVDQSWVTGLDAPKGLALDGGILYVSDIDELVAIDTESGEITDRYPAEGAMFLNDVAAGSDGDVYVTDSQTGRIHRLADGEFSVWVDDPQITSPNGIHIVNGTFVVAAADSASENPGGDRYLQSVSDDGAEFSAYSDTEGIGALDAVEPDGQGGLFLTDWGAGTVMHFTEEGGVQTLLELSQGTADLEYSDETGMIYLPVMMSDRLIAYRVDRSGAAATN